MCRLVVEFLNFFYLCLVELFLEPSQHTIICNLGGVWDKREDGVVNVAFNSFENGFHKQFAEFLPLLVYVAVRATAEINPLERTGRVAAAVENFLYLCFATLAHYQGMPRL